MEKYDKSEPIKSNRRIDNDGGVGDLNDWKEEKETITTPSSRTTQRTRTTPTSFNQASTSNNPIRSGDSKGHIHLKSALGKYRFALCLCVSKCIRNIWRPISKLTTFNLSLKQNKKKMCKKLLHRASNLFRIKGDVQ